jgi:DNA-binding response OmpR family regulator
MIARILLIEGKKSDHPSFVTGLKKKGFQVDSVSSGSAALTKLFEDLPHLVLVDVVSMQTNGRRIIQSVHGNARNVPLVLIVDQRNENIDKLGADVVLVWPFTLQKLLNRIRPLLPSDQKNVLQVGPLQLDTEQRWVRCLEKHSRLTPRLVALLKVLMEHPGEIIERNTLFSQVWDTTYTEDTRTLDVHVSWLRKAFEEDPRHPRFVKTVRGVGYRLDVDDEFKPHSRP